MLFFHKLFLFYLFLPHIYISVYAAELLLRRCASELPDCCCCAAALTGCCTLELLQFSFKIEDLLQLHPKKCLFSASELPNVEAKAYNVLLSPGINLPNCSYNGLDFLRGIVLIYRYSD